MQNCCGLLLGVMLWLTQSVAQAQAYQSPYRVKFSFSDQELIGDILTGPRGEWKEQSGVPFSDWYAESTKRRFKSWGPSSKHYAAPAAMADKTPQWQRERIIATALKFTGYAYQHHHIPDWAPPINWPQNPLLKEPVTPSKGIDCSNFTAFVYNLALGIKPTGDVQDQSVLTAMPGPGEKAITKLQRIAKPESYESLKATFKTGDLLFIKNRAGEVSHVVLWIGNIGISPDDVPLIIDSTSEGAKDSEGNIIPGGVQLRPVRSSSWYAKSLSHGLRVIAD
ncbi:hypothetical protein BH11VER1_BH11VER1_05310 [soil metagenome]